jgi:hypothetical protein
MMPTTRSTNRWPVTFTPSEVVRYQIGSGQTRSGKTRPALVFLKSGNVRTGLSADADH